MSTTMRAHCGACAEPMVLRWESAGWYYVCYTCGAQTEPRESPAKADADVVWVPVTTPTPTERGKGKSMKNALPRP